ncbi:OsmC family peroxiredoxin [Candidatus Thorarchaeota archaeon]|nr:MAG: OsmC family peroxiredoxin [Candidatus Thorarchaeota archaeon]
MSEEHSYQLESRWVRDKIVTIEIEGKEPFEVATPPDFWADAPAGVLSPEDLFLASAVSCYGVSLSGVAKRYHGEFSDFRVRAEAPLTQGEFGWEFERIDMQVTITVPSQKDKKRITKAAERAHKYCVVSNSMKCPVNLQYEITIKRSIL